MELFHLSINFLSDVSLNFTKINTNTNITIVDLSIELINKSICFGSNKILSYFLIAYFVYE